MVKLIILVAIVFSLLVTQASAAGDACTSWNSFAAQYHFETYAVEPGDTFYDAYFGPNFASDFAAILAAVASDAQLMQANYSGNDLMNASLEHWQ